MLNGTNAQSREVKLLYSLKKKNCDECAITIFSRVGTENDHFEKVMTNLYKNKKKNPALPNWGLFLYGHIFMQLISGFTQIIHIKGRYYDDDINLIDDN